MGRTPVQTRTLDDATGIAGNEFTYNTPELTGFEAYNITLYVDYALLSLTVVDASLPPPSLDIFPAGRATIQLSWPTNAVGYALVSATNMPATVWNPVTNSVTTNGNLFTVRLEAAGCERYFQLRT